MVREGIELGTSDSKSGVLSARPRCLLLIVCYLLLALGSLLLMSDGSAAAGLRWRSRRACWNGEDGNYQGKVRSSERSKHARFLAVYWKLLSGLKHVTSTKIAKKRLKVNKPINTRGIAKIWREGYQIWFLATNEYSNAMSTFINKKELL